MVVVVVAIMMVPVIMVMLHPVVTMFHSDLISLCKRVPILVTVPAVCWRAAEHHRAVGVQGAARLPVIVGCIHAVVESTAVHIVEVGWRNIPPRAILIALLLLRRGTVLLCV